MGYHTDQTLDLDEESDICIFSCYKNENTKNLRTLNVINKETKEEQNITMYNNNYIIFSVKNNKKYVHKIILEKEKNNDDSEWLGLTMRCSKTYIKNNVLPNGNILYLASKEEENNFYKLKTMENNMINYEYPIINYTISKSDLMNPSTN
jgi:hypothetical protein